MRVLENLEPKKYLSILRKFVPSLMDQEIPRESVIILCNLQWIMDLLTIRMK